MAQTEQQLETNVNVARQMSKLEEMLRNPETFTPEERIAGETMLRNYVQSKLEGNALSPEEMQVLGDRMRLRITGARSQRKIQKAKEAMQAPGRLMSQMTIGASEELHNLALLGVDIVSAGLKVVGADEGGPTQNFIQNTRSRVLASREALEGELEAQHIESYGSPVTGVGELSEAAGHMVGKTYPYLFVPANLGTWTRTVLYNGLVGAAAGGAQMEDAENLAERFDGMAFPALVGMFASGVLNARQGFQKYAARKMEAELNTQFAKESAMLEKQIQEITGQPNFHFSLGQITANPFVVGLEIGAAREVQRDAQLKRLRILRDSLKMRASALRDAGRTPAEIVEDLQFTANEVIGGMRKQANSNFADAMDNIIANWGDDAITDGRHYLNELTRLMDEWQGALTGGHSGAIPKMMLEQHAILRRYVNPFRARQVTKDGKTVNEVVDLRQFGEDMLDQADSALIAKAGAPKRGFASQAEAAAWASAQNKSQGGLNAQQTKDLLKGFRRIIGGDVPLFEGASAFSQQNLGQAMRRAFLDELELGVRSTEARNAIAATRKIFETDALMMDGVRRTMLTDMLGNIPQTGHGALLATFTNRTPKELAAVRNFLLNHDEVLLYDLQRAELERAVAFSRDPNMKRSLGNTDIFRLGEALSGSTRQPGSIAKGLWSPAEQAELSQVGRALQTLQETHLSLFPEASGSKLADIVINMQSRSPEFVARLLTRLTVSSTAVSKFLNDPQARRAAIDIANSAVGSPKYQLATVILAMTTANMIAEDEAAERAERARQSAIESPALQQEADQPHGGRTTF